MLKLPFMYHPFIFSSLCEVAPEVFPQRADFGALCSSWSPMTSLHSAQTLPCSAVSWLCTGTRDEILPTLSRAKGLVHTFPEGHCLPGNSHHNNFFLHKSLPWLLGRALNSHILFQWRDSWKFSSIISEQTSYLLWLKIISWRFRIKNLNFIILIA